MVGEILTELRNWLTKVLSTVDKMKMILLEYINRAKSGLFGEKTSFEA